MRIERIITPAKLAELVRLDAGTGLLTWRERGPAWFGRLGGDAARVMASWNTKNAGRPAFAHRQGSGYLHGGLMGKKVLAHRVVWALWHGSWPTATIDHINGNRQDNRPTNLRDVAHVENMRNQPRSKANKTGVTGVSFNPSRRKYEATVCVDGKTVHLGRFDTATEAASARRAANEAHGFHPNHGRDAA